MGIWTRGIAPLVGNWLTLHQLSIKTHTHNVFCPGSRVMLIGSWEGPVALLVLSRSPTTTAWRAFAAERVQGE